MTSLDILVGDYFEWLYHRVCQEGVSKFVSYRKLLKYLHTIEFRFIIPRDQNRAEDGISLRYRFALEQTNLREEILDIVEDLSGPCSVLEMLVALAIHGEEDIMDDPSMGDRTGQWFWTMITNLGLGSMIDSRFNAQHVDEVIDIFMNRTYDPDGRGGLFVIHNCDSDLRDVEIWWQMCWYFNTIS